MNRGYQKPTPAKDLAATPSKSLAARLASAVIAAKSLKKKK